MIRNLFALLCALILAVPTMAGTIYRTSISVTNPPAIGDSITIDGVTRTWTNVVSSSPSTLISTDASLEASATNLYNHLLTYRPPGIQSIWRTNITNIFLESLVDDTLTITTLTDWALITNSTMTSGGGTALRVPYTVSTASERTNLWTLAAQALEANSQAAISKSAKVLENYVDVDSAETVQNKDMYGGTNRAGYHFGNTVQWMDLQQAALDTNNFGVYLKARFASNPSYVIAPDPTNGYPMICYVEMDGTNRINRPLGYPFTIVPYYILTKVDGDLVYGQLLAGYGPAPQAWGGTNRFVQITNSVLVNCTFSGTISDPTITGATSFQGTLATKRLTVTSLANGNNSGLSFANARYVKFDPGTLSADFAVCGIAGGTDGRELVLENNTGFNMTVRNDSGVDVTPANRIYTMTGADIVTVGAGMVHLLYDTGSSRWKVVGFQP